jgi:gluconate 2-dehydrogenase gamma chain
MSTELPTRRAFLVGSASGAGAAWLAANWSGIAAAQEHVQALVAAGEARGFAFFTPEQAADVEAMTAQIIPTDETPGAREARVVDFIDRVLVTFDAARQPDYAAGLEDLSRRTARTFPSTARFSTLGGAEQIRLLTSIEDTPFFELVRTHTITGFLSSPVHGGNHDRIGWELIGYDVTLDHLPPFGYYDALPDADR